jgi:hypothetical protein
MAGTKTRIRNKRTEQLLHGQGNYTYGNDFLSGLIQSARRLLGAAATEQHSKDADNYLTFYGPSAILLIVTAFEVILNEALHDCLFMHRSTEFENLAKDDSFIRKFSEIPALLTGGQPLANGDVELLHHIRNEIVHYYPRHVKGVSSSNIPEWLESLAQKHVLYTLGTGRKDIGWLQKLQSYKLVPWCATTAISGAEQFADALTGGEQDENKLGMVARNFRFKVRSIRSLSVPL